MKIRLFWMHPNTIFFYILNYYDTLYGKNDVTKIIYYTEFYSGFNEQTFKIGLVVEKLLMCLILVSKLLICPSWWYRPGYRSAPKFDYFGFRRRVVRGPLPKNCRTEKERRPLEYAETVINNTNST